MSTTQQLISQNSAYPIYCTAEASNRAKDSSVLNLYTSCHIKKHPQAANWYHFNTYSLKNCHTPSQVWSTFYSFFSGSFSLFTHSIAHPIAHSIWNSLRVSQEHFYSVPRDYDAVIIKFFSVDKKNQLDLTFCILYFSSNSCSTCFEQLCAHHQELTTAWCYSLVLICAVAAGRLSSPVGR